MTDPVTSELLTQYARPLNGKVTGTIEAYLRALRKLIDWISQRSGSGGQFAPVQFIQTALETYLSQLQEAGGSRWLCPLIDR